MNATRSPSDSATHPAIIAPWVDTLAVGGLSLLVFVPLLLSGRHDLLLVGVGAQAWLGTMLNMPHFLASYRMVYRSKEIMLRHKWASIYIPLLLFFYIIVAIWQAQYSPALVSLLLMVSSGYLAWHYTGQAWGMMATFAYLEGVPFLPEERRLVRGSLRILLVWHVTWFLHTAELPFDLSAIYTVMSVASVGAFILGAVGLARTRQRTGRLPPVRSLVAWLAIFSWYAVIAQEPKAIFLVQIAHAVQYLIFPVRVEINVTARTEEGQPPHLVRHMLLYGILLLGASYLMSNQIPGTAMSFVAKALGEQPSGVVPIMIFAFLNIHHYFTDGVMWKLRNPAVREDLFAHLPAPAVGGGRQRRNR